MDLDKPGTAGDIQELLAVRDRIDDLLGLKPDGDPIPPKTDLLDLGDAYRLVMEVPGVSQANLEIALQGSELIVAGIRNPLRGGDRDGAGIVFSERPSGHFQRTVNLPGAVDREAATAQLHEGLLVLTLPKS